MPFAKQEGIPRYARNDIQDYHLLKELVGAEENIQVAYPLEDMLKTQVRCGPPPVSGRDGRRAKSRGQIIRLGNPGQADRLQGKMNAERRRLGNRSPLGQPVHRSRTKNVSAARRINNRLGSGSAHHLGPGRG